MSVQQDDPLDHDSRPLLEWGRAAQDAELAVLAVHGRAQTSAFMRETAQRFGAVAARFYAPDASGSSWYPHPFLDPLERNQPDLDDALRVVELCLTQLARLGFPARRVVLWGFSQGACLLSHYALTVPQQFGGIILFTGGHLGPQPWPRPQGQPLNGVPTVLRSIDQDPWVPRWRVEDTGALLADAGASVDLRIDPGTEHVITGEACAAATRLLTHGAGAGQPTR